MEDIQIHVFENIDDIDTMIDYCSQNKVIYKKCMTTSFWRSFFIKHDLEMPKKITSLDQVKEIYKRAQATKLKDEYLKSYATLNPKNNFDDYLQLLHDCGIVYNGKNKKIESIDIDYTNNMIIFLMTDLSHNTIYNEFIDASQSQIENFLFNLFYNDMVDIEYLD